MINKTKEDYLRAIYHIQEEKQDNKSGVSSIDISKYLNISRSSVSEMLRNLIKEGFIQPLSYGKIKFTYKGSTESIAVTKKHRIIEVFLNNILKIEPKHIHNEAHRLEHAFSNQSIRSITRLIESTETCPHGKPIPK